MITPNANTVLRLGDRMFLVCAEDDSEAIMAFIGPKIEQIGMPLTSRTNRWCLAVFW